MLRISYTSNEYLQILLAIVWPLLLFILILFFVLLAQQYAIGVTIVKKKKGEIYLKLSNLKNLMIQCKSSILKINNVLQNYDDQQPIVFPQKKKVYKIHHLYKKLKEKIQGEIQQNQHHQQLDTELVLSQQEQIQNIQSDDLEEESDDQNEKIFVFSTQIISEKKADLIYEKLFKITQVVEIFCSITIVINLIFTYGRNLISKNENQQQYVTIIATFIFVCAFILRNLSTQLMKSMIMTFQIFFNLLITIVYSQMYNREHFFNLIVLKFYYSYQFIIQFLKW